MAIPMQSTTQRPKNTPTKIFAPAPLLDGEVVLSVGTLMLVGGDASGRLGAGSGMVTIFAELGKLTAKAAVAGCGRTPRTRCRKADKMGTIDGNLSMVDVRIASS